MPSTAASPGHALEQQVGQRHIISSILETILTNEFPFGIVLLVKWPQNAMLGAAKAVLRVGLLSVAYMVMLLGIVAAFRAQEQQTGAFQINFEYRAF